MYLPYTKIILLLITLVFTSNCSHKGHQNLPKGFVFLKDVDPTIIENVRYYGNQNFTGRNVYGYEIDKIICTEKAAKKLSLVNQDLKKQGYTLVVYDGYRPQSAVNSFIKWSNNLEDQVEKNNYYPTINKKNVFNLGYVSRKSGHTRGSTFDLTMIKNGMSLKDISYSTKILQNGETIPYLDDNTIDMGSSFDLFHNVSNHDTNLINEDQKYFRNLLRNTMKNYGFEEYKYEWWHYTLKNEPYDKTYFNFIIRR